jgi:hypothetical protein
MSGLAQLCDDYVTDSDSTRRLCRTRLNAAATYAIVDNVSCGPYIEKASATNRACSRL